MRVFRIKHRGTYNRTMLELKFGLLVTVGTAKRSYNRTMLELKFLDGRRTMLEYGVL